MRRTSKKAQEKAFTETGVKFQESEARGLKQERQDSEDLEENADDLVNTENPNFDLEESVKSPDSLKSPDFVKSLEGFKSPDSIKSKPDFKQPADVNQ